MLDVFTNQEPSGSLAREGETSYLFSYLAAVGEASAVSLVMPPSTRAYAATNGSLHPVFDMNIPEGALWEAIMGMFGKTLPVFDDFALLEIVGASLIGRLRFGRAEGPFEALSIGDLLKSRGTGELFQTLVGRFARRSGISGVQPKLLIRDDGSLFPGGREKLAVKETTHIVKAFDPQKFPGLAANEFLCLEAARASGLTTVKARVAGDGGVLAVERFDLGSDGSYLGFEDACVLADKVAGAKYEGSYEDMVTLLGRFISPGGLRADVRSLFKSLIFSMIIHNGDAHRKNFGVLYEDATRDVRLAPVYDVLTTEPYLPGDRMALTLEGSKNWPDHRQLVRFGVKYCGLSPSAAKASILEVVTGVAATLPKMDDANLPKDIATVMRACWEEGLARVGP